MAIPRRLAQCALSAQVSRACARAGSARSITSVPASRSRPQPDLPIKTSSFVPRRWHSAPSGMKIYEFADMQKFSESPSPDRILIDVREPAEYEEGYIPGAVNMPIKSQPDAIFLPEEEFEDRFGYSKPDPQKELVFYCKAGVRGSAAAQLARQHGYANVAEYRGSWLDWQKNGGKASKP